MLFNKIVHISPTPLVGAPGKIALAQRQTGKESICFILSDYPSSGPLYQKFSSNSILLTEDNSDFFYEKISGADVVHIHNFIPDKHEKKIRSSIGESLLVYHAHSPLREGPLFYDRSTQLSYDVKLVVGQHWGRLHTEHIAVPNIIFDTPSINLRKEGELLKVMYSPTHKHKGRWTSKGSSKLDKVLDGLLSCKMIELIRPKKPVSPYELFQLRRTCHLTIDEIITGGFHQVSIEGMCAGNIVVNGADFLGKACYSRFSDGEFPPFLYANDDTITDTLVNLASNVEETRRMQQESYDFFVKYCDYKKLVEFYDVAYRVKENIS
ncbi:hypothetical protein [Oceanobacter antarcticus]|uniref:Glycosyl transferases group 1 n=1 Tax=Oceanobacter antarcticus TaxID=3133425 RepID=A0ABW8NGA7_9GAMM